LKGTGKGSRAVALFSYSPEAYDVLKHLLFLCPEFFPCCYSRKKQPGMTEKTGLK